MTRGRTARLVLALSVVAVSSTALAADTTVRLGDASVRFDRARWQASVSHDSISFAPQGEAARELDPVVLHVVSEDATCAALAERAYEFGHYDASDIEPAPAAVGGLSAERFAAHTGCRNATPQGVILCVKKGSRTYLLQALQAGCGGRNLFSGIDPLAEITSGITFARDTR
jgi:hypothetical protein